jgi:hypothetical protein|tara:strand:- start:191 stop:439 length:249 start_codon:yes stop_codon:yes gene_type:complete
MLGNLIGGFIVILVGVNLMPAVADGVWDAQYTWNGSQNIPSNVTGAASTIVGLVTLFFALGIMSAGISVAAQGLRSAGLLGA